VQELCCRRQNRRIMYDMSIFTRQIYNSLMKDLNVLLQRRKNEHRYRQRDVVQSAQGAEIVVDGKTFINFSSNDYLGLANDPAIVEALTTSAKYYGVGSGAAHLITGHSSVHHDLEQALAEHVGRSRALLFSTGYMANIGVITALCGRDDMVIEDRLNHASLIDGGLYSGANFKRYAHSDMDTLQRMLQSEVSGNRLVVTDGVFSMDGDIARLNEIMALANKYDADVLVDDAHGIGVLGQSGGGICETLFLQEDDKPILMATLGKAFGVFGAFVAGSEQLIEWLIQQSRTYVYTTSMPSALAAASLVSLKIIQTQPQRREKLQDLITLFQQGATRLGLNLLPSQTAIQALIIGDEARALNVSESLRSNGLMVKAIRPPTVPYGSSRLRITLSAAHEKHHVDKLLNALERSL